MENERQGEAIVTDRQQSLFGVLVVDGSGSISRDIFQHQLKLALREMVNKNKTNCRWSLIQFSSNTQIYCQAEANTDVVLETITKMQQMGGGTNTKEALEKAIHLTDNLARRDSTERKAIFLITDGRPDREPVDEVRLAAAKGLDIYAIGVGNGINSEVLGRMATNKLVYHVSNWDNLVDLMNNVVPDCSNPPVQVEVMPANREARLSENLELIVRLCNQQEEVLPAKILVDFPQNYFFQRGFQRTTEPIQPNEFIELRVRLRKKSAAKTAEFPAAISVIVSDHNDKPLFAGNVQLGTGFLAGHFGYHMPLNVLMFGPKGAGKSSLINSFVTCLSLSREPLQPRPVAKVPDHVTTKYEECSLYAYLKIHEPQPPKVPLVFWDTWGYSPDDYTKISVKHFLKGYVKQNQARMVEGEPLDSTHIDVAPDRRREILVVVFVLPISAPMKESIMAQYSATLKAVLSEGFIPILVVTQCDYVEDENDLRLDKAEMLSKCGLDPSQVYWFKNYSTEKNRDISVDLKAFELLDAIFRRAKDRIMSVGADYYENVFPAEWWAPRTPGSPARLQNTPNRQTPHRGSSRMGSPVRGGTFEVLSSDSEEPTVCENGHESATPFKFCPECGKPPKPKPTPKEFLCVNGHSSASAFKFCPECGGPPQKQTGFTCSSCGLQADEVPKFCPECGRPSKPHFI